MQVRAVSHRDRRPTFFCSYWSRLRVDSIRESRVSDLVLPRSAVPSPCGAEAGRQPSKYDEMYEARDLTIVPVDSTDPEVRANLRRFAQLESPFHSGEQAAASQ